MPVLIAIIVLSFVVGLLVPRPGVAYAVAAGLGVLANVVFVWAIADGKGDDSAWLLLLSLAAAGIALGATWVAIAARRAVSARKSAPDAKYRSPVTCEKSPGGD